MKMRAVNTNVEVLGLDLHSNSPKLVNFFGAQSSLGGAQFSSGGGAQAVIWGARPRNAPSWRWACQDDWWLWHGQNELKSYLIKAKVHI